MYIKLSYMYIELCDMYMYIKLSDMYIKLCDM